ncbi:hypothetical protein Gotri_025832 [Gossypium trilobum]|uniref:Uncharacterized protein n=1 Tax=Gossypium trilobum TaxID=34281 RepID=A0A7J9FLR9_9ROSI|nr:hypothetical protein [Gossypium trilobum]
MMVEWQSDGGGLWGFDKNEGEKGVKKNKVEKEKDPRWLVATVDDKSQEERGRAMLMVAKSEGDEGVEGLGGEGVEVVCNQNGEGVEVLDGLDASIKGLEEVDGGLNSSVEKVGEEGVEDESDNDSKDENVYLMNVVYFSNGDNDEELQ